MTQTETKKPCRCQTYAARLTNGVYYLSVGTWFGAIVMLALAAAATFKTVRDFSPILPNEPWNHPELVDRAAPILAGAIVGTSLGGLKVLQIICAVGVVVTAVLQCTVFRKFLLGRVTGAANLLRLALLAIPLAMLLLNICHITPRIIKERQAMWDTTQPKEVRDEAHARFTQYHKLSERTMGGAGFLLLGAVLVSSLALGSQPRRESCCTDDASA